MADVTIETAAILTTSRAFRAMAWATASVGYFFFIDDDQDFKYKKTTDAGATWGSAVTVYTGTVFCFDIWFDAWTPGNSGTLIHTAFVEDDTDDIKYRSLDTNGDTLGTQTTVLAGNSAINSTMQNFVSIARMRGGNLLVVSCIDTGAEGGLFRSVDVGATWTSRTSLVALSSADEWALAFPGNEADTQDGWFVFQNKDTNLLTLRVHDDSANTNSASATILTVLENTTPGTGHYPFSAAVRHSDGHLILAVWSDYDSATADFRVFDINGTGSITELTAIATNIDDCYHPAVYIDPSDQIYVAYVGKRDGSETLGTTVGVYYVKSTNGGTSWSAGDTAYSATTSDWRNTWAAPNGPRFAVAWRDISSQALLTNADNSISAAASIAGAASVTLAALTNSSAGVVALAGTSSSTLGALTLAASAVIALAGTSTPTLAALTSSAAGTVALAGSATPTLAPLTSAAAGAVALTGTAGQTLGALTLTAAGDSAYTGTASIAFAPVTASGTGALPLIGSALITLSDVTASAAAALGLVAAAAPTLAALTLTAQGGAGSQGELSVTLGPVTSSAAGTLPLAGTLAQTLGAITSTATGVVALTATSSPTLGGLTLSATGAGAGSGALAGSLAALTANATGAIAIAGAASPTLGALTGGAAGAVASSGILSQTLGALTLTAGGGAEVVGAATLTLAALVCAAVGAEVAPADVVYRSFGASYQSTKTYTADWG